MSEADSIADDLLRSGYQRWLNLEEQKAALGDDLKELFAELKAGGFAPKALRESFRRVRNIDDADQQEHDAIVDLYVASLTRGTRAYTREANIYPDPRTPSVDGGRPNPSSDAGGAKIDGSHAVEGRATQVGIPHTQSEQQPEDQSQGRNEPASEEASSATPFEPPAFLQRNVVIRPYCQRPENCGGYGSKHCGSCERDARRGEAA